jgi:hypothetical protein
MPWTEIWGVNDGRRIERDHRQSSKMANSIDTNRDLQATYKPNHTAVVRLADAARERGRDVMREAANATRPKK